MIEAGCKGHSGVLNRAVDVMAKVQYANLPHQVVPRGGPLCNKSFFINQIWCHLGGGCINEIAFLFFIDINVTSFSSI